MRSLYKTLGALTIAAAIMFGSFETADAAKRRVVVEDHTGAWCGWCVRGTQSLRDLKTEFGDDVIAVQIHNSAAGRPDDMAIPEIQGPLSNKIGLTGFPSGSVNRMRWNLGGTQGVKIAVSDGYWSPLAKEILVNQEALKTSWADVDVKWNLDDEGKLIAEVTVNADATATGNFGINLFVMEDGVTGTGNGYNQQNYLSNRAGFEGHYYYDKPAVITGYVHDNVLRYMLGGIYGEKAPIASQSIKAGDSFKQVFTANVSGRILDLSKVWVVATVHNLSDANFEIVNAKMSRTEDNSLKGADIAAVLSDNNPYNTQGPEKEIVEMVKIDNPNDFEIVADLKVNSNSLLMEGWSAEFVNSSITIPANSSANAELKINSSTNSGLNMINISASAKADGYLGGTANLTTYSYAENTKFAYFYLQQNNNSNVILNSIYNDLTRANIKSETAIIPLDNNLMENYDFTNVDLAFIPSDASSPSMLFASNNGVDLVDVANKLLDKGKSVLISTNVDLWFSFNATTNYKGTTQAVNFYNNIGIKSSNFDQTLPYAVADFNSSGQILVPTHDLFAVGIVGDDVTTGMNLKLNNFDQNSYPYLSAYVDLIKIEKPNQVTPILLINHKNANTKPDDSKALGVKVNYKDGKLIYFGFSLELIRDEAQRTALIKNSIKWLLGETASTAPNMILNTDVLNFGKVGEATDLDIEVSNTGNAELVIDEATISLDDDAAFTVAKYPNSVAAGAKTKITVTYTPKDGKLSTAVLRVVSNAGNKTVALSGEGVTSSVDDYLANTGLFVMNVTPNPVASQSLFQYELNSNSAENVELKLVDANGLVVANLFNGIQTPGTHTINLDANNYANGKYFIIANLLGHSAQFPVVIAK